MSFPETMANDLDVFYNTKEFAIAGTYNGSEIVVLNSDEIEVSSMKQRGITAKSKDLPNLKRGDIFEIGGESYSVNNFDFKDSERLEYLIALEVI